MTVRRWLFGVVAAFALLLLAGRALASVYAEWTWYAAMHALPVYESKLFYEALLKGGAALVGFAVAFANLYAVRRSIVSLVLPRRLANVDFGEEIPGQRLTGLVVVISVAIAFSLALLRDDWVSLAMARAGIPFGERDPYQDRDFGFYVYDLPFERSLYLWSAVALLMVGAAVVFLYALTPSLRWERGKLRVSTYVRRHFAVLGALLLLIIAWGYRLESMTLLSSGSGQLGAYTAFDDGILVPLLTGLSVLALATSLVVFWAVWHGHNRIIFAAFSLMVLGGPVARLVLPLLDQWSTSEAVRAARERPFISTRVQFTRRAFGVDRIVDAAAGGVPPMTREDIALGVPSWDPLALVRSVELAHRDLTAIATSWVPGPAGITAVVVLRQNSGSGPATKTTIDAVAVDAQGHASAPTAESPDGIDAELPAMLVEPNAPPYVVVADSGDEISAPAFASFRERLAHSWRLQSPRLLAMDVPEPRPRIMLHRDVRERIRALVPFFAVGPTLQGVVLGDALFWVAELFVTSDEYPLARMQPFAGGRQRYVRHAATAVVQAHTGRVFIVSDASPDPMTRSWIRRFPGLFVARDALRSGFGALWPPAVDWGTVQAVAIAHAGFPGDSPKPDRISGSAEPMLDLHELQPRPYAQHGVRGPLTAGVAVLESDAHMVGVLVVRGGDEPRVEWHRVVNPLSFHGVVDTLVATAKRAGFKRARRTSDSGGEMEILPVETGFAFVQSFYARPTDGAPTLTGVVVLDGREVHAGRTLADALGFAAGATNRGATAIRSDAAALYEQMSAAMKRGDWNAFGAAFTALGRLLRTTP